MPSRLVDGASRQGSAAEVSRRTPTIPAAATAIATGTVAGLLPPAHAPVPAPPPVIPHPYAHGPVEYYGNRPNYVGQSHNGMAIAGFVLSLILPLFGLIFSLIALNGMKTSGNPEGKGFATAGLVISIVLLSLVCLYFIGLATCFGAFASR